MDSIKDVLVKKSLDEPTEITALKSYCQENFNFEPKISIKGDNIWLLAPNGILATELRMRFPDIKNRCGLTRKLIIRVG